MAPRAFLMSPVHRAATIAIAAVADYNTWPRQLLRIPGGNGLVRWCLAAPARNRGAQAASVLAA